MCNSPSISNVSKSGIRIDAISERDESDDVIEHGGFFVMCLQRPVAIVAIGPRKPVIHGKYGYLFILWWEILTTILLTSQ